MRVRTLPVEVVTGLGQERPAGESWCGELSVRRDDLHEPLRDVAR